MRELEYLLLLKELQIEEACEKRVFSPSRKKQIIYWFKLFDIAAKSHL
jgi:hypothetical protein